VDVRPRADNTWISLDSTRAGAGGVKRSRHPSRDACPGSYVPRPAVCVHVWLLASQNARSPVDEIHQMIFARRDNQSISSAHLAVPKHLHHVAVRHWVAPPAGVVGRVPEHKLARGAQADHGGVGGPGVVLAGREGGAAVVGRSGQHGRACWGKGDTRGGCLRWSAALMTAERIEKSNNRVQQPNVNRLRQSALYASLHQGCDCRLRQQY
jgi:hypothetical protein